MAQLVLKKEISKQLSKKIFRQSLYNFLLQLTKAIMSTNNSREILACRRQVLSREQREGERQRARVNTRRASENDRQRECVRSRRGRENFSEVFRGSVRKLCAHLFTKVLELFHKTKCLNFHEMLSKKTHL